MKNKNTLTAALASRLLGDYRVVTRYMGSGINRKRWGGIRDHSAGIWDHKPWDPGISITVRGSRIRFSDIITKTTKF